MVREKFFGRKSEPKEKTLDEYSKQEAIEAWQEGKISTEQLSERIKQLAHNTLNSVTKVIQ